MKSPLLAFTVEDMADVLFPVYASPKLDGIRALQSPIRMVTRSIKDVPNQYVQDQLKPFIDHGLDGELIVGDPTHPLCYTLTSSGIMSRGGTPDFTYYVFDKWKMSGTPFSIRHQMAAESVEKIGHKRVRFLEQKLIRSLEELTEYECEKVELGYEGIMVRSINGIYKHGRSTPREGILGKVKRWRDTEGVVVGYKERFHNANEATINALGYTERSGHQENLIPMDTLGAVILRHPDFTDTFDCGSGFTDAQRAEAWAIRDSGLIGRTVTFKYQEVGVKDKPRFPIFKGWRHPE